MEKQIIYIVQLILMTITKLLIPWEELHEYVRVLLVSSFQGFLVVMEMMEENCLGAEEEQ